MTQFPAANAGASFQVNSSSGRFHGEIVADNADRLRQCIAFNLAGFKLLARELLPFIGKEMQIGDAACDVGCAALRQGSAIVDTFRAGEIFSIFFDQVGKFMHGASAFSRVHIAPVRESFLRSNHRMLQILLVRIRHERIGFADGRVFVLEILADERLHQIAADEIKDFLHYRQLVLPPSTGRLMPLI